MHFSTLLNTLRHRSTSQCEVLPCSKWHKQDDSVYILLKRRDSDAEVLEHPSIVRTCDRTSDNETWFETMASRCLCVIEWHSDTLLEWHLDSDVNCLRSKSVVEARRLSSSVPSPEAWRREPSPPERANSLLIELAHHGSPIPWQSELINRRTR